jgi:hypothetical protein
MRGERGRPAVDADDILPYQAKVTEHAGRSPV